MKNPMGSLMIVVSIALFAAVACLAYPSKVSDVTNIPVTRICALRTAATLTVLISIPAMAVTLFWTLSLLRERTQRNMVLYSMVEKMGGDSKTINSAVKEALATLRGVSIEEMKRRLDEAYILQGTLQRETTSAENVTLPQIHDLFEQVQTIQTTQADIDGRVGKMETERKALLSLINKANDESEALSERVKNLGLFKSGGGYDSRSVSLESAVQKILDSVAESDKALDKYVEVGTKLREAETALAAIKLRIPQKT